MVVFLTAFRRRKKLRNITVESTRISALLRRAMVFLGIVFALHIIAMLYFEGMGFADALWLTLTTVTTVGYGDLSASTLPGRAATILLLYGGGIFVLAKSAGDYFDFRMMQRDKKVKGFWRWNLSEHIVIINTPEHHSEQYLVRLIEQIRASDRFRETPVQILCTVFPDGLPESIKKLGGVVHFQGRADDVHKMQDVNVGEAAAIIVLAGEAQGVYSDGRTFDILHRLSDLKVKATILAECGDDENRARLLSAGADTVIRPIRAYPEMIVRALVAPGSELIIENMFTSNRDEYLRYEVDIRDVLWADVACQFIRDDLGIVIAYIDSASGELECNPSAHTKVQASALFLMVRDQHKTSLSDVERAIARIR